MAPNTPTSFSVIDPTFDVSGLSNNAKFVSLQAQYSSTVQEEHEISSFTPNVTHLEADSGDKIYISKCS